MRKKGSLSRSTKRKLRRVAVPPLANAYMNTSRTMAFVHIKVKEKDHPRFIARQKKLDEIGVSYDRYAVTVFSQWLDWCKGMKMHSVPVNIFLGNKAWERFMESYESTVQISTRHEEDFQKMVYMELRIAQLYIGGQMRGNIFTASYYRNKLKVNPPSTEVVNEVVDLLSQMYDLEDMRTYDDIVKHFIDFDRRYNGSVDDSELQEVSSEDSGLYAEGEVVSDIRPDTQA